MSFLSLNSVLSTIYFNGYAFKCYKYYKYKYSLLVNIKVDQESGPNGRPGLLYWFMKLFVVFKKQ